jgi:hypothetical protein
MGLGVEASCREGDMEDRKSADAWELMEEVLGWEAALGGSRASRDVEDDVVPLKEMLGGEKGRTTEKEKEEWIARRRARRRRVLMVAGEGAGGGGES